MRYFPSLTCVELFEFGDLSCDPIEETKQLNLKSAARKAEVESELKSPTQNQGFEEQRGQETSYSDKTVEIRTLYGPGYCIQISRKTLTAIDIKVSSHPSLSVIPSPLCLFSLSYMSLVFLFLSFFFYKVILFVRPLNAHGKQSS